MLWISTDLVDNKIVVILGLRQHVYCRSASRPSFLKTYFSATCNAIVTHGECVIGCTTLGTNVLNCKH